MCASKYRILMFSPAFAPLANPEAIVNSKLALAMLDAGWEVDIISRNLSSMTDYDYGSVWISPWLQLKPHTHEIQYELGNKAKRFFDTGLSAFAMGFFIDGCRWAKHAFDYAAALNQKNSYNVILSRALPPAAHLPALKLAKKTGLPWIANWNDPWEFLRSPDISGGLLKNIGFMNYLLAHKIADKCSLQSFPGENLLKVMCNSLNAQAIKKSVTIPHIALSLKGDAAVKKESTFTIGYLGRLRKQQDPKTFFEGVKIFSETIGIKKRILFRFVGIDDVDIKKIVRDHAAPLELDIVGGCSYLQSLTYASSCDVLLVIDPQETNGIIMTSKFVDYVQTGKPILAITTPQSTLEEIMRDGGGIAVKSIETQAIANALCELYAHWEKGTLNDKYGSQKLYNLFSPETIIGQYKEIFKKICVI